MYTGNQNLDTTQLFTFICMFQERNQSFPESITERLNMFI